MAHIATCVAHLEPGSISASKSSSAATAVLSTQVPTSSIAQPFAWRMLPTEQRKYQLFPKDKQLPNLNLNKSPDPETAFALAMGDRNDKQAAGAPLRLRVNQQNPARRRKISVPELEPMTTVQEIAMDSPTIPGRPPLHERSASAPEDVRNENQRAPMFARAMRLPIADEFAQSIDEALSSTILPTPLSQSLPRQLAPLVIPKTEHPAPLLQSRVSIAKLRSDSTPPSASSRSGRMDNSPLSRSRITPSSSTPDLSYPRSATTDNSSAVTLPTPISAPIMESHRASPGPWDGSSIFLAQSERGALLAAQPGQRQPGVHAHRRGASESSTSMMDRGRSRKRVVDIRSNNNSNNNGALLKSCETKRSMSCERKAFEELPSGWKPAEAAQKLSVSDMVTLQRQALGQAERFEVLKTDDVEALSKELRHLDERTEYLRRTYTSLRAGRRNLHSRICQYLRSPRVAKFSHESMLKQEEALAELDASIDDWVTKLEQAENRRMRVRQKLLEHVAAAAILPIPDSSSVMSESLQQVKSPVGPQELSTPPRSPSAATFTSRAGSASPSPQRVVAQVPSTILEQPVVVDEAKEDDCAISRSGSTGTFRKSGVESIRIYAGDDVYALLADVENEISKMGAGHSPAPTPEPKVTKEIQHQRQRSHEKLTGRAGRSSTPPPGAMPSGSSPNPAPNTPTANTTARAGVSATPQSAPTTTGFKSPGFVAAAIAAIHKDEKSVSSSPVTPRAKDAAKEAGILLTAAVFKP